MATNVNNQFGLGGTPTVAEGYDPKTKKIKKLKEFAGAAPQRLFGYIITKDAGYGRGVLLCLDTVMVSLPKRYLEVFEDYTTEQKELLRSGRVFLADVAEVDTKMGKTFAFNLVMED